MLARPLSALLGRYGIHYGWVIIAVTQAAEYYRKFRERELSALELEKRLAQAKLQALQMQVGVLRKNLEVAEHYVNSCRSASIAASPMSSTSRWPSANRRSCGRRRRRSSARSKRPNM